MPTVRRDKNGQHWLLLGKLRDRPNFGPMFGYEEKFVPSSEEPHYSSDHAYSETVHAGGAFDRVLANIRKRRARSLLAILEENGINFRTDGTTLWVGPSEKLSADDCELIRMLKPELIALVGKAEVAAEAVQDRPCPIRIDRHGTGDKDRPRVEVIAGDHSKCSGVR